MKKIATIAIFLILGLSLYSQNDTIVVDKIIARVGDEIILKSDLEAQYASWLAMGNSASPEAKCKILEDLIIQKLLINQAHLDSLTVTDDEIQQQVEGRLQMFVKQYGSEDKVEEYLNKPMVEIKKELGRNLKDQLLAEKERDQLTGDIKITPSEVTEYYVKLPKDSLPLIEESYEIRQIVLYPKLTKEEEQLTIDKLNDIRQKIVSGQRKFESMARIFSDDDGSRKKGGNLGIMGRAELDPDFANAAFSLKEGEVSQPVKTKFGYHLIEVDKRYGDRIQVKHILIRLYIPTEALNRTIKTADSIRDLIVSDSLTFSQAAEKFSDDEQTKNNGGYLINTYEGTIRFTRDQLPPQMKADIRNLKEGEISQPVVTKDFYGNTVVKIYKIEKKIPAHIANPKDDYDYIYRKALNAKKNRILRDWVRQQKKTMYISIDKEYRNCKFKMLK